MRILSLAAALALSACGQTGPAADAGCARTATHDVTWSNESAPDIITTQSAGPSCAQAVVMFVVRNADGDPLWAFASTYYDMRMGGAPPEGAAPVPNEEMDEFLAGWANVSLQRSSELPEWREGFDTLSASAQTFSYDTPFDRETYEMLRARDLQMICYAAAVEASQCLIIDPASHAPIMMVAYGP
jgi:hypothetical protein